MTTSISCKEFEKLIINHGFIIECRGNYGKVKFENITISSFAVSYGKNSPSEEIKLVYIKNFFNALRRVAEE